MKSRRSLSLFLLAAFPLAAAAQVGSVVRYQHVNEVLGGFQGALDPEDEFGRSLAGLGDVDGDGVADLAVGASGDDDAGVDWGAIWILFLNGDGTVRAQQKISQTQGGFGGVLTDYSYLGARIANVGDLDGDGIAELGALSSNPYRLWILFLDSTGRVRRTRQNLFSDPVFVPPTAETSFGGPKSPGGLVGLGDLDGDGVEDIAVGSPLDPAGTGPRTGSIWILGLAADGSLRRAQKIANGYGGLARTLEPEAEFGRSLVFLGDLDGDGLRELGVHSRGTVFEDFSILSLDASGAVASERTFGAFDYGLTWPRGITWGTAHNIAALGDLDGDGLGEVALEFAQWNFPDGPRWEGGLAIGFQRADGSVSKKVRISHQRGGLGDLPGHTYFGTAPALLGDLDGDGNLEIAVGAPNDRGAGEKTGGIWILSLSRTAVRNGSGVNPVILSQASEPVFGATWTATLDCAGHAPGLAVVFGHASRADGIFTAAGELLLSGTPVFFLQAPHVSGPTALQGTVPPYTVSLVDLAVSIQGLCTGAPGNRLSNALDVVVGR